jgi:hypothetical protein
MKTSYQYMPSGIIAEHLPRAYHRCAAGAGEAGKIACGCGVSSKES